MKLNYSKNRDSDTNFDVTLVDLTNSSLQWDVNVDEAKNLKLGP